MNQGRTLTLRPAVFPRSIIIFSPFLPQSPPPSIPQSLNPALTSRRGQGTLEYAVVLAAVSAALMTMAVYLRRGIAGELRRGADSLGEQYDPRNTTGNITLGSLSDTTTTTKTLNEPKLREECLAEGKSPAECDATCDLSDPPNGNCTDLRVFGTTSKASLNNETVTRTGSETVGALGNDLWN